jgi:hypothetical protein
LRKHSNEVAFFRHEGKQESRTRVVKNAGCLFEFETLASARHIQPIVLLCDSKTDRAAAERSLGLNKREQDSIVWQDVKRLGSAEAEKILGFPLDVNPTFSTGGVRGQKTQ